MICIMFHCLDQTALLKYLMKYSLSRHLSSKKERAGEYFVSLWKSGFFCKYLAEVVADVIALTQLVYAFFLHTRIAKDKLSLASFV